MTTENVPRPEAAHTEDNIPTPTGYMLLISLPQVDQKFGDLLYKADSTIDRETITTMVGRVIDMGPDAYKDDKKFPSGPYCETGDWVLFKAYSGLRFKVGKSEWRMITDDMVQGVVKDPRAISHV